VGQLLAAADERRERARQAARAGLGLVMADLGDEPVAPAMMRLEVAGRADIVAEGVADLLHAHLDRPFLDDDVAPDGGEELRLRHEHPGVLDEVTQDVEGLRAQAHPFPSPVEGGGTGVEAKTVETCLHAWAA
jgi:hypothetical protein